MSWVLNDPNLETGQRMCVSLPGLLLTSCGYTLPVLAGGNWGEGLQGKKGVGTVGRLCLEVEIRCSCPMKLSHGSTVVHCLGTAFVLMTL